MPWQKKAGLVIGLDDGAGQYRTLPFSGEGSDFYIIDQQITTTSASFQAFSPEMGLKLSAEIVSPFWPGDIKTSTVPALILNFRIEHIVGVRWTLSSQNALRRGVLRFAFKSPELKYLPSGKDMLATASALVGGSDGYNSIPGGLIKESTLSGRKIGNECSSQEMIAPLSSGWRINGEYLEAEYDLSAPGSSVEFSVAIMSHVAGSHFDRRGCAMKLKYNEYWRDVREVAAFVRAQSPSLLAKSRQFDSIWRNSSLSAAVQDLTAVAFQSYLMNTMWCVASGKEDYFSVWEGSCRFNSTVDVTYNEAMFYFSCWPELLEMIFHEWSSHVNDPAAEAARLNRLGEKAAKFSHDSSEQQFDGAILEHDMGFGWTASGQTYPHAMPVEENSNFLLLLYWHGKWWGREKLFRKYKNISCKLAKYLLWADSKGNGFPDRGTANTIDDATPAVQYGRDNVYLGIKRLAALHAAAAMLRQCGEKKLAARCAKEVALAVKTLNKGWLGDHWGVCLDKSAVGLLDSKTGKPLPYKTLPGWDAYSLYTTNGLLPLMMIDDLPKGLDVERLRKDVVSACSKSMTTYGCGHSSLDKENMWVSMNLWRDCAAGYLGVNMLDNSQRYWNMQLLGNGSTNDHPTCYIETSLTNNLIWYPRGAAVMGLPMAIIGMVRNGKGKARFSPVIPGRWPILTLSDWKKGKIPYAVVEQKNSRMYVKIEK